MVTELNMKGNYKLEVVRELTYSEQQGFACSFRHEGDLCPSSARFEVKVIGTPLLYPCCKPCLIEFGLDEEQLRGEWK